MPFNPDDYTKAPWTNGVMTLTNDECGQVKTACEKVIEEHEPTNEYPTADPFYVVSTYNKIDWTKAINGDTYDVLVNYNSEVNTQGISPDYEGGIAPEPEIEEEQPDAPESTEGDETTSEGETSPEEETQQEEEIQGA